MNQNILRVGHSPDPDDAFMFYGLAFDHVRIDDYKTLKTIRTIALFMLNRYME